MSVLVPPVQGLVATVQSAVGQAFEALADFQQTVQLERYPESPQYDSTSGSLQNFEPTTETVPAIILDYEASRVDEEVIQRDDQQVLIERARVTGADITTTDRIRAGGSLLRVIDVSVDPSGSLYTLQVREAASGG